VDVPGGGLKEAGSRDRSNVTAHLRVVMLGSLAVVVFALGVAAGSLGGARMREQLEQARASNGRCVVYTYFEDQGMGDGPAVDAWRDVWSKAGWDPKVLTQKDAAKHPRYDEMVRRFMTYPTSNPAGYELACYLRYLAMVSAGGGFMSDYDVVNVNVPPPPKCDWLPNGGTFTTHEHFVPSLATGSAAEFDRVASEFYDADVEDVLAATQSGHQVSDMILDLYLSKQNKIRVGSSLVGAEHVTESPCDDRGDARPLLFHFSHSAMEQLGQTASDRPDTMRAWADRLRDESARCDELPAEDIQDIEKYAKRFFA
jgi:hypothetical protein